MLSKKWILILINAILVTVFGLILIFVPVETLKTFIFLIGVLIAFTGLVLVFGAFNSAKDSKSMVFWLFQGLFNLVIGAMIMIFPEASIKFLLILAGLWAIVLGVYQFSVGLISESEIKGRLLHKINGSVAVILGLFVIFFPELIIGLMIQIFGLFILAIGVGMFYFSFLLRKSGKLEKQVATVDEVVDVLDSEPTKNEGFIP